MRRTVAQVLARFDEALGIDRVPRAHAPGAAPGAVADAAGHGVPGAAGGVDRPRVGVAEARAQVARASEAQQATERAVGLDATGVRLLPAAVDRAEKAERLAEIESRHAASCPHCTVARGHRHLVFGEGDPGADVMFVGEAPGEVEDACGRPFVGPAGQKLDEMIRAMGLRREETYIANALKSRPPENRTPLPSEVAGCGPFLVEQLLAVRPRVIVTLGGPATKLVVGTDLGITRLRGTWQEWRPPAGSDCAPIPVMPTYHPSYVLRNYTPKVRGEVWSDLKRVLERLGRTLPGASASGS